MLLGNGFGFWKTMPMRRRSETASTFGPAIDSPSNRTSPSMRASAIRSFIRLKQRRRVLLPQPEGPMRAVIRCRGMSRSMSFRASDWPYQTRRPRAWRAGSSGAAAGVAAGGVASVADIGRGSGAFMVGSRVLAGSGQRRRRKRFRITMATAFMVSSRATRIRIPPAATGWNARSGSLA